MKYNEDRHNTNKFYSKACGVSFNDLLLMEYITLKYLEWNLFREEKQMNYTLTIYVLLIIAITIVI